MTMPRDMPLRIVFADCCGDPWLDPMLRDLATVSESLRIELLVLGGGGRRVDAAYPFVETDTLYRSVCLGRMQALALDEKYATEQMHLTQRYLVADGLPRRSEAAIRRQQATWWQEAISVLRLAQPDAVIVWNGLLYKRAIYAQAARALRIPLWYAEKGLLAESWFMNETGVGPRSTYSMATVPMASSQDIDAMKQRLSVFAREGKSAWEQPQRRPLAQLRSELGIAPTAKVIFFPGQVDADSNMLMFSPHFSGSRDALQWMLKGLEEQYVVLVKPHPKGSVTVPEYRCLVGSQGRVCLDLNVLDAIDLADCVVSVNSTVAFEAAVRPKPVLLLGDSVLRNCSFVQNYIPGLDAKVQVDTCLRNYQQHREEWYAHALSFAHYLATRVYAYRNEPESVVHHMAKLQTTCTARGKLFSVAEIVNVCRAISPREMGSCVPARTVIPGLALKLKRLLRRGNAYGR